MSKYLGEASGRVNLIGEHTDYNGGFVLPTAIPQKTKVRLSPRPDGVVRAASRTFQGNLVEYKLGEESRRGSWSDYIQGVTHVLAGADHEIWGFDAEVESDVPVGSGLSSSAALEVALMRALREAFGLSLGDVEMARLCQRVENEFVGAKVGIMDPMAAALSVFGTALFLDTRSLTYEPIPLGEGKVELVVINSGISHRNVGGGYNQRRRECEEACRLLGARELRDVFEGDLARIKQYDLLHRRARHVVTENARVLEAVKSIRAHDFTRLGELFVASHASMRDDYEVSIPEIDALVEKLLEQSAVYGARLTGGGFGGSVVALAKMGHGRESAERAMALYRSRFTATPTLLVP